MTLGDKSGFETSSTAIWGFFNPKSDSSLSVSDLMFPPFLPMTIPGLVTNNVIFVPTGVFEISTREKPASLISFLR